MISREGDVSDSLFILASGSVEILRDGTGCVGRTQAPRRRRRAPNHFGEMGLLTGQARSATVIARDDVLCYRLDKRGFDAILQGAAGDRRSAVAGGRRAARPPTTRRCRRWTSARSKRASGAASELVRKIREFFDLHDAVNARARPTPAAVSAR